jgi:hypothetical protein
VKNLWCYGEIVEARNIELIFSIMFQKAQQDINPIQAGF